MEFRLLGEVSARSGAHEIPLGPRQQRLALAVLALEVNRPVPIERLVDAVWPVSPPRTANHAVRVCVSQLRSVLGDVPGIAVETHGSAYLLRCDPLRIDVHLFQALIGHARDADSDERAVELFDQALKLWHGSPLAGVASPETRESLCGGLEVERMVAVEDRLDALLRLGRHRDLLGELTSLAEAHPTRERLIGQLMLALYRSGQASQALEAYRRTRAHLSETLGVDPGAELWELELAILRNSPTLRPAAHCPSCGGPLRRCGT
ncbi:BTAD domain-containing putative transcriptional regulator [Amycolatopsis sp. cg5]|uniref:AfsR/SARP family transcriptional regulator n=1 Tax=Amycolatopsis sp. cg5 TaxID=3238802 RepID=UPI003523EA86